VTYYLLQMHLSEFQAVNITRDEEAPPYYPPTSQPQYPPTSQPYYPPTSQPQYPPTSQPQYPPTSQPGYGGYPPPMDVKYPPQPPGYAPVQQPMQQSQMSSNNTTVIMAGGMAAPQPQTQIIREVPSNYMAFSWIVCLFCCWPIGIAAIMASSRVDTAVAVGNFAEAKAQSNRAKGLGIAGLVCGIIIITLVIIRFTVLVSVYSDNYYN